MAVGDVWKKLRGTMRSTFGIGNEEDGFNLKNSSGVGEIRNAADDAYETLRADHIAAGGGLNDLPTLRDLQARVPNIEFSFDGDTAPSAGTNSGKFGICHTDGTGGNAGEVFYDSGTVLSKIPTEVVRTLTTSGSVTGTLSLIANGLYAWQGSTWVLKGDGAPASSGQTLCVEVPIGTSASHSSTTNIPSGARVVRTSLVVDTAYDAGATAVVSVDGATPVELMASSDSKMSKAGQYDNDQVFDIGATNTGLLVIDITGTPAAGAGSAFIWYVTPSV